MDCLIVSSIGSPLRYVFDFPVGFPIANESFGDQFLSGMIELGAAQTENLRNRAIRVKTLPFSITDHHQKEVEDHRLVAQPMKVSAMKDLVVDNGIAPCPSHGSIVGQPGRGFNRILYLAARF
jgi:hypothetical protein